MKPALLALLAAALLSAAAFDDSAWVRVLKASVNEIGEVDYAKLRGSQDLEKYIRAIEKISPANQPGLFPGKADELAYYLNAYNALTIWGVLQKYPVSSIGKSLLARGLFFRYTKYTLGGEKINLEDLEKRVLRSARYSEPRIHFAIVCASLSCPKLSRDAFNAANLERQLESETREYFSETRNLRIDATSNTVTLAAILDWYKLDFQAFEKKSGKEALLAYALRYSIPERRAAAAALKSPKIVFRDYDWSINDLGSRARAKTPEERQLAGGFE